MSHDESGMIEIQCLWAWCRELIQLSYYTQILQCLDNLKLSQYKQSFEEECIDGLVLADCDQEILEKELHVVRTLHQKRLMQIIEGKVAVSSILKTSKKKT